MKLQEIHTSDWNVLVILDSMRYDAFEEMNVIPGELTKVDSGASCTLDWFIRHFPDEYPYVYVSASPVCIDQEVEHFGRVFNGGKTFKKIIDVIMFGYSEECYTVLPGVVTASSMLHLKEDKVIIHYIQPHFPYIGSIAFDRGIVGWGIDKSDMPQLAYDFYMATDLDILKQAYDENVEIVLEEMDELLSMIPDKQKVVITSDHGELFEEKVRFHPCGHPVPELIEVPWLEVER